MNIRRGRSFKKKKPFFSFGYFLLPVLGLLALGFLILGVRLLFFQPSNEYEIIDDVSDSPVIVEQPREDYPAPETQDNTGNEEEKVITAVPVKVSNYKDTEDTGSMTAPKVSEEAANKQENIVKSTPTNSEEKAKIADTSIHEQRPFWSVQVGAFTVRDSADKLAAELQKSGYDVFVVSAEVGGKKYYRVRVKAGKTKQEAQKIAGKLSSEGYPTFIAYEK
ncbi:Sporulation domain-containing protein [Thermovirga lienii DSM 17291]|jgi:cell division protein FtsN|uniref:Sporulation domain-containing protein n=1 Tax=Thermovirga lienii (strain ATCC BAA-1197 / DSM 17291 / Cas60314) TaxID=580340 RepID=G7VA18_THELD|nr:SPOR domain-containing protein [Thermovirga lienii]AER66718.1 Sporulation domain-containing protein [Thermovirga lienii DSM 17291]MDN5368224.1 hypothetical protein [Thermovirga sp.]HCD70966.1 SPOR domain-containing protein [Thermovirga lienii]